VPPKKKTEREREKEKKMKLDTKCCIYPFPHIAQKKKDRNNVN
jgi:hypothetical protein